MGRRPSRLVLALAATGLALLAAEGLLGATGGPSLLAWLGGGPADQGPRSVDGDGGEGPPSDPIERLYVAHPDPAIGLTLRPDAALTLHGAPFRTDGLGLRAPPAPPADDAWRVIVLGDSVAFGYGLADGEALAGRLARRLAGGRPVHVRSVAVPGWTLANAAALLDRHADVLACDLVVALPMSNDLNDGYTIDAAGRRVLLADPAREAPAPRVSMDIPLGLLAEAYGRRQRTHHEQRVLAGSLALEADLSPESSRRLDGLAATIRGLERDLAARGTALVLGFWRREPFTDLLVERLGPDAPPALTFLGRVEPAFTLPDDPHPNATTVDALAAWTVELLAERGLLPADVVPAELPAPPGAWRAARADRIELAAARRRATEARQRALAALRPALEPGQGEGVLQVLAGVHGDGVLEQRALVLLARGDGRLRVALEGLPDLPAQELRLTVDGVPLGAVRLPADGGAVTAHFDLPPGDGPVEVDLAAERTTTVQAGRRTVRACARLVRLATGD